MTNLAQRPLLSRVFEKALDLVFPPRCAACDAFGAFLCERCIAGAIRAGSPRCPRCWMPKEREAECWRCRARHPAFSSVRSVFVYDGAARESVHAIKFRGISALAPIMGGLMAEQLQWWRPAVEAIIPVPLSGHRRRMRGYNQSELLAREVAQLIGVPLETRALVRRRATAPQARQPGEQARRRNVVGAFRAGTRLPFGGILLIDDVVTTGATLDACARVLLEEGAGPVFALTFARED